MVLRWWPTGFERRLGTTIRTVRGTKSAAPRYKSSETPWVILHEKRIKVETYFTTRILEYY